RQQVGCPPCGQARRNTARRTPPQGKSGADKHPELVRYFIENLTNPGTTLAELKPSSHADCLWRCATPGCGNTFTRSVNARLRAPDAGCLDCRPERLWETRRANPD